MFTDYTNIVQKYISLTRVSKVISTLKGRDRKFIVNFSLKNIVQKLYNMYNLNKLKKEVAILEQE